MPQNLRMMLVMFWAASTGLDTALYVDGGNPVHLGILIFSACMVVYNIVMAAVDAHD